LTPRPAESSAGCSFISPCASQTPIAVGEGAALPDWPDRGRLLGVRRSTNGKQIAGVGRGMFSIRYRGAVLGLAGLVSLASVAAWAGGIDRRLFGAWTAAPADCSKTFRRNGSSYVYRPPIDVFAPAFIIEPERIATPTGECRVANIVKSANSYDFTLDCHDSISYLTQSVQITINSYNEILYSPIGNAVLATKLTRCSL
jgi:hypothetical protein